MLPSMIINPISSKSYRQTELLLTVVSLVIVVFFSSNESKA